MFASKTYRHARNRVGSGWTVRTKPQAPRPLLHGSPSSSQAVVVCGSYGGTYDPPTQDHAGGTPASQLLRQDDPVLPAVRRALRTTLRQVTRQARPGASAQLSSLSAQATKALTRIGREPRGRTAVLLRAHIASA